jgi:hypothetical protein
MCRRFPAARAFGVNPRSPRHKNEKLIMRKQEKKRDIQRKSKHAICILKNFQKSVDKAGAL